MTYAEEFRSQFEKQIDSGQLVIVDDKGNAIVVDDSSSNDKQKDVMLRIVK